MERQFQTLRIGEAKVEDFAFDLRVVRELIDPPLYFVVYAAGMQGPFAAPEDVLGHCARTFPEVSWRAGVEPRPNEAPCPICEVPRQLSERYPKALCPVCVLEAVDSEGKALRFYNTAISGGFEARLEDGTKSESHLCFVRKIACYADEARFGGIVVQTK